MTLKNSNKKQGFTLVELLVAISIVVILSGIVLSVINVPRWQARSRDVVRKEELSVLSGALERYYADNSLYPVSAGWITANNTILFDALKDKYINTPPTADPKTIDYYYSTLSTTGQDFCLCAVMEDLTTPEIPTSCQTPPTGYNFCLENTF